MQNDQRIAELFDAASELPAEDQSAFLAYECAGQPMLLSELVSLLGSHAQVENDGFMNERAVDLAARETAESLSGEDRVGEMAGRYKILTAIGEGGMGEVYLAEDTELNRRVAIKLIKSILKTKELLRRFGNERRILSHLNHENITRLLDVGTTSDGVPFLVMEYIQGQPLGQYCEANNLSTSERLKLFRTICSAVQYAHQNLIVHRDLKPSNVLVTGAGQPKLLDFGIAKLFEPDQAEDDGATATMLRVMTLEYASPEQVRGEPVTTASDIYSLGVVLYELLTGCRPYKLKHRSSDEISRAICHQEPEPPSRAGTNTELRNANSKDSFQFSARNLKLLRGDIDNIVLKTLRKEPGRRYASVEQFSEDIRRYLEGLPVGARKGALSYRAAKFVSRNKIAVAAAAVILMTLIGGIVSTTVQARRASRRFNDVRRLAHSVLFDYNDAIAALPGATPARERLVQDALRYLDSLAGESGDDFSLQGELASAYLKVGDVQGRPYASNLGQTEGALTSYRKAAAILERLSASEPSNSAAVRRLAAAYECIGNIHLRKGEFNEALDYNSKALAIRQALLANDPLDKDTRSEVADSYLSVGDARQASCIDVECVHGALDQQQRALEVKKALAGENPADNQVRRGLARAYTRVGFRFGTMGLSSNNKEYLSLWLENEQKALAIRKELAEADPTNAFERRNLADQLMLTGNAQVDNGDIAGALGKYVDSLEIFRALSSADPTNAEASRDLSFIYVRLAATQSRMGDVKAARDSYAQVLFLDRLLQAEDPTNYEDIQTEVVAYQSLSHLSEREGNLSGAIENYRKAMDLLEKAVSVGLGGPTQEYSLVVYTEVLADLYKKSASQNGTQISLQIETLREARSWYQKSLVTCLGMEGKGTLHTQSKPDELRREIAECDALLSRYQ